MRFRLRKSAVLESLVDFQKQIDFKGKVLKHVANRAYGKPPLYDIKK